MKRFFDINHKCQDEINEKSGITLMILTIIIILLLIIAGAAITISINGGDLFGKTQNSVTMYNAKIEENEQKSNEVWSNLNIKQIGAVELTPVYAKLYTDGTLILSREEYTDSSKTVMQNFNVVENKTADNYWSSSAYNTLVTKVAFYDKIAPSSTAYYFNKLTNLVSFENIENLETGLVTDMKYMFAGCESLASIDLRKFNTRNVTDMSYMFSECAGLTSLDLQSFRTSNVTNMSGMFYGKYTKVGRSGYTYTYISKITELDLSKFDTSNVTNMSRMFQNQVKLSNLDISSFNTENVTDMSYMFADCMSIEQLNLSSFSTQSVSKLDNMFYYTLQSGSWNGDTHIVEGVGVYDPQSRLETIYVSDLWDLTGKTVTSGNMFYDCKSLRGGRGTVFNSSNVGGNYARVDTESTPGYFTWGYR